MAAAWPASSFSFSPACGKVLVSTNEPTGLSRFAMASPDKTGSFLSAEIPPDANWASSMMIVIRNTKAARRTVINCLGVLMLEEFCSIAHNKPFDIAYEGALELHIFILFEKMHITTLNEEHS